MLGQIDPGHPEIHAALTAAAVFLEHSQSFVNLSMHEQRLYRILTAASNSLQDMKAKRIAARQADLDAAVALSNLNKMLDVPNDPASVGTAAGFVSSPKKSTPKTAAFAVFWKPESPRNATATGNNSANTWPRDTTEEYLELFSVLSAGLCDRETRARPRSYNKPESRIG
jgi:hypothetical protein